MNFLKGLIKTIEKGEKIIDINEDGKSYIVWKNIINVVITFPVIVYLFIIIISDYKYNLSESIAIFKDSYIGFLFFSIIFRVFGISYLGTYIYIYNYILKK